jgi:hypothetical protein
MLQKIRFLDKKDPKLSLSELLSWMTIDYIVRFGKNYFVFKSFLKENYKKKKLCLFLCIMLKISWKSDFIGQKYFQAKIFPYISYIKTLVFKTFSWSHSLSDFHEIFSIIHRNITYLIFLLSTGGAWCRGNTQYFISGPLFKAPLLYIWCRQHIKIK